MRQSRPRDGSRPVVIGTLTAAAALLTLVVGLATNLLSAVVPADWQWARDWTVLVPVGVLSALATAGLAWWQANPGKQTGAAAVQEAGTSGQLFLGENSGSVVQFANAGTVTLQTAPAPAGPAVEPEKATLDDYLGAVRDATTYLDLTTVPGTSNAPRTVEELFVQPSIVDDDGARLPALTILEPRGSAVVIGESGAGKSALLQFLAWRCANEAEPAGPIPFLVPLKEFTSARSAGETTTPARDFIGHATRRLGLELPDAVVDELLRDGRCLILLDGFDEVPPGEPRARVIGSLRVLANVIRRGNGFVVTSRPADKHELNDPNDLHRPRFFRLDGFGFAEIERFATRWYSSAGHPADHVRAFVQTVRTPQLDRLARSPLYLTIMALLSEDELDLVEKQPNKLFEALTQHMLHRDRRKRVGSHTDTVSEPRKRARLGAIARILQVPPATVDFRSASRRLVEDGLVAFLRTAEQLPLAVAVDEAESFLRWCVERAGLLTESSYEFRHAMLRQYFAANSLYNEAIDSADNLVDRIVECAFDPRWDDGIHFLMDQPGVGVRTASDAVVRILGTPHRYREITRTNVLAAVRVMAACRDVVNETRANVLDEFFILLGLDEKAMTEHWLSGSWRRTYREALSLVPLLRGSSSEPPLVSMLLGLLSGDQAPDVRRRSCEVLGVLGSPDERVLAALVELMRLDSEPTAADTAGQALARIARFHESVQRTLCDIMSSPAADHRRKSHTWRALLELRLAFDATLRFALHRKKVSDRRHRIAQWTDAARRARDDADSSWDTDEPVVLRSLAEALGGRDHRTLDAIFVVRRLRISEPDIDSALRVLADDEENGRVRGLAASTLRIVEGETEPARVRAVGGDGVAETAAALDSAGVYAGEITHYWPESSAACVLVSEPLTIGSKIRVLSPRTPGRKPTDFTQHIESMMDQRRQIDEARPGMAVSIAFSRRVRRGDHVYLLLRG